MLRNIKCVIRCILDNIQDGMSWFLPWGLPNRYSPSRSPSPGPLFLSTPQSPSPSLLCLILCTPVIALSTVNVSGGGGEKYISHDIGQGAGHVVVVSTNEFDNTYSSNG
jgi:hypothetical protein